MRKNPILDIALKKYGNPLVPIASRPRTPAREQELYPEMFHFRQLSTSYICAQCIMLTIFASLWQVLRLQLRCQLRSSSIRSLNSFCVLHTFGLQYACVSYLKPTSLCYGLGQFRTPRISAQCIDQGNSTFIYHIVFLIVGFSSTSA